MDRRMLMARVNVLRAVVMAGLAIAVFTGTVELYVLYAVAFLQGIGEVFSDNAAFALLPNVVPKDRLEHANGRLEAALVTTSQFAGPAAGGALFALAAGTAFAVDAATFALAALLVAAIQARPQAPRAAERATTVRQDIREGVRWLRGHAVLRRLTLIAAATNLVLHGTFAIFVLYAMEVLGLGAVGFGILLSIEAIGAVSGSLVAARSRSRLGVSRSILIALMVAGAANLVIALAGHVVLVAVMAAAVSFAGGIWNVVTASLRQSLVPDHLLGRVQSAHRLLSWGAIPVGTLVGGFIASAFGVRAPFFVAAVVLTIVALAAYVTSSRIDDRSGGEDAPDDLRIEIKLPETEDAASRT